MLNTILPATIMVIFEDGLTDQWYPTGGQIVLNALIADFIFIGALVDRVRPDVMIFRKILAKRAQTQRQMNALYKRPADIYLAVRLQLVAKYIVCGIVYSPAFPILYPLAFLFCVVAEFVDRRNLLRVWAPPPPTDNRLIASVVRLVLPAAILGHMIVAYVFFRAKDADSPSTMIALVNGCVFGPLVLYFVYREHMATKGVRVQIVPDRRLRTLREWFFDLKDETLLASNRSKDWQPAETFREFDNPVFYVPPLTRALLQAMGETVAEGSMAKRGKRERVSLRGTVTTPELMRGGDDEPGSPGEAESPDGSPEARSPRCGNRRDRALSAPGPAHKHAGRRVAPTFAAGALTHDRAPVDSRQTSPPLMTRRVSFEASTGASPAAE